MDQQRQNPSNQNVEEATFGGSRLRMEYDRIEEQKQEKPAKKWENILVTIAFGAVVLMVTMVLIAAGASLG